VTDEQAIAIARKAVEAAGGVFSPGIVARKRRRWVWFGRYYWTVITHYPFKGNNWFVDIDDLSAEVLSVRNRHHERDRRARERARRRRNQ
jgi:hypothetical protein